MLLSAQLWIINAGGSGQQAGNSQGDEVKRGRYDEMRLSLQRKGDEKAHDDGGGADLECSERGRWELDAMCVG